MVSEPEERKECRPEGAWLLCGIFEKVQAKKKVHVREVEKEVCGVRGTLTMRGQILGGRCMNWSSR